MKLTDLGRQKKIGAISGTGQSIQSYILACSRLERENL